MSYYEGTAASYTPQKKPKGTFDTTCLRLQVGRKFAQGSLKFKLYPNITVQQRSKKDDRIWILRAPTHEDFVNWLKALTAQNGQFIDGAEANVRIAMNLKPPAKKK